MFLNYWYYIHISPFYIWFHLYWVSLRRNMDPSSTRRYYWSLLWYVCNLSRTNSLAIYLEWFESADLCFGFGIRSSGRIWRTEKDLHEGINEVLLNEFLSSKKLSIFFPWKVQTSAWLMCRWAATEMRLNAVQLQRRRPAIHLPTRRSFGLSGSPPCWMPICQRPSPPPLFLTPYPPPPKKPICHGFFPCMV